MKLQYFLYNLPFSKPFKIAGRKFPHRKGIVIKFSKDGTTAWGEAAPLPGFSSETLGEVINWLRDFKQPLTDLLNLITSMQEARDFFSANELPPAVEFCIFTLCSTFLAQKKRVSLHQLLFGNTANRISINAVIDLSEQDILSKANMFKGRGFKTIKIKAGPDHNQLIEQLAIIRNHHPEINLRIDANQSWSLDQAQNIFQKITAFDIEYCEEPLENPNHDSLTTLRSNTSVPIALDESLTKSFTLEQATQLADVIIIKPMVLGTQSAAEIFNHGYENNRPEIVYTTSLECAIGRLMTSTLAAGQGSKTKAHGLATGQLFSSDFWDDEQFFADGFYNLPDAETLQTLMNTIPESITLEALDL